MFFCEGQTLGIADLMFNKYKQQIATTPRFMSYRFNRGDTLDGIAYC